MDNVVLNDHAQRWDARLRDAARVLGETAEAHARVAPDMGPSRDYDDWRSQMLSAFATEETSWRAGAV